MTDIKVGSRTKRDCRCGEKIRESNGEWIHTAFKNDPYYCVDGFRPIPKEFL